MSLFIVVAALGLFIFLGGKPLDLGPVGRLRPLPRSFRINVWGESHTCFAMLCRGLTSTAVLSARSDRILQRSVTYRAARLSYHSLARTEPVETDRLESYLIRDRGVKREGPTKSGLFHHVIRGPPSVDSTVAKGLSL